MHHLPLSAVAAVSFALSVAASSAQAAPPAGTEGPVTIVVAPPILADDAAASLRIGIAQATQSAPARAGAQTVALGDDRCAPADFECLRAATAEHSRWMLRVTVERRGPDSIATAELVDVETGSAFATLTSTCEICGEGEVIASVEDLIAQASRRLTVDATPSRVEIVGEPARVDLFIDGESVGAAPYDAEIPPGNHEVTIVRAGYQPQLLRWEAEPGVAKRLTFALVPLAKEPEPEGPEPEGADCEVLVDRPVDDPKARKIKLAVGGASLGLGLAGVATGATLLAIDGDFQRSTCDDGTRDPNGLCPFTWSNVMPGAIGVGVGSALTGLGIGLLATELSKKKRRAAEVARARLRDAAL